MKIKENIFALDSTKGAYVYLVRGKETILIDNCFPGRGKKILKELEFLGVKPESIRHILITHYDVDHIGNAVYLQKETGAKVWASAVDIPYIIGEKERPGIKKYVAKLIKVAIPLEILPFPENGKFGELEIISTPGHTPGHISILFEDVLFAGDMVIEFCGKLRPSPGIMTWNHDILMESIKKTVSYPFTIVCPAHGKPVKRGNLWERML